MTKYLEKPCPEFSLWAALVIASALSSGLSLGMQLHRLAVGLLTSSIAILALMSLFEIIWLAVI